MLTRRSAVVGGFGLAACSHGRGGEGEALAEQRIAAIEARIGGRVGVGALNTETGAWIAHRPHERFAMASTFKWLLAAAALERLPHDQQVRFSEADLLDYAPTTRARRGEGAMSVEDLCEAVVVVSDNTAANLLLANLSLEGALGPGVLTAFLRAHGDGVTRIDRNEPILNENAPGDERDTTTPDAMARTLQRFLVGDALNVVNRNKLTAWMIACQTGRERLRAGLPAGWRAGDKSGTGRNGAANDVAIVWPPDRPPILIACYLSESPAPRADLNAAHAEIARSIVEAWS